jgi:hypothetical protein
MRKIIVFLVGVALLSACRGGGSSESAEKLKVMDVALAAPPNADKVDQVKFPPPLVAKDEEALNDQQVEKKIIKEGDINFQTTDINNTRKAIYDQIKRLNGYVSNESEADNGESDHKTYTISTHIPTKNFDLFVNNVSEHAVKIDSKNISTTDVTTQFIDINTRLVNKKKLEERYLDLLKQGNKIADLLAIENKLSEIRTDIESTQGQLNYLNKQVAYSSLSISFYTKNIAKENGENFGYKITKALGSGWQTMIVWFFGIVSLWPLWIFIIILVYSFRKRRAKIHRNKN